MSLIQELKRRKVVRVALGYLVLGWVLLQVADTIAPMMNLPETAPRFVLFLLIVLFPVAVFLAWAFELRPTDGVELSRDSAGRSVIAVAIAVVLAAGFSSYFLWNNDDVEVADSVVPPASEPVAASDSKASIAVLPFVDLSASGDQEYFGDGIAEELLNVLASLDALSVASRTSAFAFKGENRNVSEIASILDVSFVLEGSVRKASDRLRITAQLIDTSTDRHLWSDTYDRELNADNVFAIQDEIAKAIVTALDSELDLGLDDEVAVSVITENFDAYDLYLQSQRLSRILSTDNVSTQVELLQRAVELDAGFVEAWAQLAESLGIVPTWNHHLDAREYLGRSIDAANQALSLDSGNWVAYEALSFAHFELHEWDEYFGVVQVQTDLFPDFVQNHEQLMGLGYLGAANDAAAQWTREYPDDSFSPLLEGLYLSYTGQFEAAIERFEVALSNGYLGGAQFNLADAYMYLGDSAPMTAILSMTYETHDPELLPLVPYMVEYAGATGVERDAAGSRFKLIAREMGFSEEDLVRAGPKWGIRSPESIVMLYGRYDVITNHYWGNTPMF